MTSVVYAEDENYIPTVFGIIEMNVEYSDGFGEDRSTDMDSGDSLLGVKDLISLDDEWRLAYFITIGIDSSDDFGSDGGAGDIVDASVALNHPTYGTVTMGLFESYMRVQSQRTVDIFEAGDGMQTTFDGRWDNAISYVTPTYSGYKFGMTVAADGPQGKKDVDTAEFVAVYSDDDLYVTIVHLDDKVLDLQNTFLGVKYTRGNMTYVTGYEEVVIPEEERAELAFYYLNNPNDMPDSYDTAFLGAVYKPGKNAYKLGASLNDLEGDSFTFEFTRDIFKNTKASINYQHYSDTGKFLGPDLSSDVVSVGIRYDF